MRKYRQSVPPSTITEREQEEKVSTITREYTLLTPLFGGGVEPTEYDPVTIVRATEIRGQLRFWWRACRGGEYRTVEELKAAEDAIWGKAHEKGDKDTLNYRQTVQVVVELSTGEGAKGSSVQPYPVSDAKGRNGNWKSDPDSSSNIHPYIAFPLQPTAQELRQNEKPAVHSVRKDVRFTLTITCLDTQQGVIEDALWAWETFGGIGARTRRGFGAISRVSSAPADQPALATKESVAAWLRDGLKKHVSSGKPPQGIPYLSHDVKFRVATIANSPGLAWKQLITKLMGFRQSPFGRQGNGGSHWPEAKAIRRLFTRQGNQSEATRRVMKFPRAAFGLPIVFHFPREDVDRLIPTLQGAEKTNERLASPIILRPLACRDKRAVGLALLLDGYRLPPGKIVIKEKDTQRGNTIIEGKKHEVVVPLTKDDLELLPDLKLGAKTDILQAFMDYLEGK